MESFLPDKADFSRINRVLVIKLQHLGDVLLTSPVFSTLKQQYPHLEIDVLLYADTAGMVKGNPNVANIFCIDKAWKRNRLEKVKNEWRLLQSLKARDHQLIIGFSDRMRVAWLSRLLKPLYSVSLPYEHKRGNFWLKSFSHIYQRPKTPRHIVEIHLDALRRLGVYPEPQNKALMMPVSSAATTNVTALLTRENLDKQRYIVIHPASRWMFKGWNITGFAAVIKALTEHGFKIVLVSGPDESERHYVRQILQTQANSAIDLSGQLSLQELAALIAKATCFIGLDSVAMHISAAVNTPCVALFGPSIDFRWRPWLVPHRLMTTDFSCRPCDLEGCGNGKVSECLQAIQAQDVVQATLALIEETGR